MRLTPEDKRAARIRAQYIRESELTEFASANSMRRITVSAFEDAGGHLLHESEVIEMMNKSKGETK
tara:strand:- start:2654 stop:2851 length:198 start_codon:yes stop_codon:yes gene_type:complete